MNALHLRLATVDGQRVDHPTRLQLHQQGQTFSEAASYGLLFLQQKQTMTDRAFVARLQKVGEKVMCDRNIETVEVRFLP